MAPPASRKAKREPVAYRPLPVRETVQPDPWPGERRVVRQCCLKSKFSIFDPASGQRYRRHRVWTDQAMQGHPSGIPPTAAFRSAVVKAVQRDVCPLPVPEVAAWIVVRRHPNPQRVVRHLV
jgi:hypothetical protein